MNLQFNFLVNHYSIFYREKILLSLSNQQKKVVAVALLALACLAACIYFVKTIAYALKKDKIHEISKIDQKSQPIQKTEKILEGLSSIPIQAALKIQEEQSALSFPPIEVARTIISKKDAFLNVLSSFDRQIRMKSKGPISHEEFVDFYAKQIQKCELDTQTRIEKSFLNIQNKLAKYQIKLPTPISFIQTTGQEEIPGTWAYCRDQVIIFKNLPENLLAHELFHIYSRSNPEMRKKLYALIGYEVCPPLTIPDTLKEKRLVNPDVPYLDAYINVRRKGEKVQAVPIDLYDLNYQGPGKSTFLSGVYHKFAIVEAQENGEMKFKLDKHQNPILFDFEEAEDLQDQIGKNTSYVDSPEEILADNFALMIMEKKAPTQELIEKMKICFMQNNKNNGPYTIDR